MFFFDLVWFSSRGHKTFCVPFSPPPDFVKKGEGDKKEEGDKKVEGDKKGEGDKRGEGKLKIMYSDES